MSEWFPIAGGLIAGALIGACCPARGRAAMLLGAGLLIAVTAAWISGELRLSPAFLLVDVPEALAAGVVGSQVVTRVRARPVAAIRSAEPGPVA